MIYFGLIALVCVFQSFDFSFACNGYDIELMDYENGLDNIIKLENGTHYELTSDCRVFASFNTTVARKINSALVSYKVKTNYGDLFTVRNMNLCQILSEFGFVGIECPPLPGQATIKLNGDLTYTTIGSFLEFIVGPIKLLLKICYDGDEIHPDVFAIRFMIKKKNFA